MIKFNWQQYFSKNYKRDIGYLDLSQLRRPLENKDEDITDFNNQLNDIKSKLQYVKMQIESDQVSENVSFIEQSISECDKLKKLFLEIPTCVSQPLFFQNVINLFPKWPILEELTVQIKLSNHVQMNEGVILGQGITHFNRLIKFSFISTQMCRLQSIGFLGVCDGIVKCSNLQDVSLIIGKCDIKSTGLKGIQKILKSLDHLINFQFKFKKNNICDEGMLLVKDGLQNSKNKLKQLEIEFNDEDITEQGWIYIQQGVTSQNELEQLKLHFQNSITKSNFKGKALDQLNKMLSSLEYLKYLVLFLNVPGIDEQESLKLRQGLESLKYVQIISLQIDSTYQLQQQFFQDIALAITTLRSLYSFQFHFILPPNYFSLVNPQFFKILQSADQLRILDLEYVNLNQFQDDDINVIINCLQQLINLHSLKINTNDFLISVESIMKLIKSLKQSKNIHFISLHLNEQFKEQVTSIYRALIKSKRLISLKIILDYYVFINI